MKKKLTDKDNWEQIAKSKRLYLEQKQFPALPNPYENRIQPIMHTGYLIFIRSKFIYLGLIESLEKKNLYAALSLLKSYWEDVAAFGYYHLTVSQLLKEGKKQKAFVISRKMALGGRGFLTEKMIKKKGHTMEDFKLPSIYTMMDKVDKDWKKNSKKNISILRELYHAVVAEGGHTTYLGLWISGKWLLNKSMLADLKKSWTKEENSSILNLAAMSSLIFFYYWDKFQELN